MTTVRVSPRGHVYFAACGKYVKIGFSSHAPERRVRQLPRGCKVPADFDPADTIWLMHAIPGCIMRDERRLHGLFAAHRAEGEWFRMSPAFLEHLTELRYVTYADELLTLRRARAVLRQSGFPNAYASHARAG